MQSKGHYLAVDQRHVTEVQIAVAFAYETVSLALVNLIQQCGVIPVPRLQTHESGGLQ